MCLSKCILCLNQLSSFLKSYLRAKILRHLKPLRIIKIKISKMALGKAIVCQVGKKIEIYSRTGLFLRSFKVDMECTRGLHITDNKIHIATDNSLASYSLQTGRKLNFLIFEEFLCMGGTIAVIRNDDIMILSLKDLSKMYSTGRDYTSVITNGIVIMTTNVRRKKIDIAFLDVFTGLELWYKEAYPSSTLHQIVLIPTDILISYYNLGQTKCIQCPKKLNI